MAAPRFRLHPLARRWLRAGEPATSGDGPDWQGWLLARMSRGEVVDVGGVMIDHALLRQRFACVSERCAPGPSRGAFRSCCADALVPLSGAERGRLRAASAALGEYLRRREPRLGPCAAGAHFVGTGAGVALARPGGRCVFSQVDRRGRIRCRLRAYASSAGVDRGGLQPLGCRLFPLVALELPRGRVALTVVAPHTQRLLGAIPARRYPCLGDPTLPPVWASLRGDLDWLLGGGFARALAEKAAETGDDERPPGGGWPDADGLERRESSTRDG